MKRFLGLHTLRGTIRFYAMLLVTLPVLLGTLFFGLFQRGRILDGCGQMVEESARRQLSVLQFVMKDLEADITLMAQIDAVKAGDLPGIAKVFDEFMHSHPAIGSAVYVDRQGLTAVDKTGTPGMYVGDREYFQAALAGRTYVTDMIVSRSNDACIVIIAAPVFDSAGQFNGVIYFPLQLSGLDHLVGEASYEQGGGVYLADCEGRILVPATAVAEGGGPGLARIPRESLAGGGRARQYRGFADTLVIGASLPLNDGRWHVVKERPVDDVLAEHRGELHVLVGGAAVTIVLLLPVLLRTVKSAVKPLEALLGYTHDLRRKRYDAASDDAGPGSMPEEVKSLYLAFRDMATEVRSHIEEQERLALMDPLTGLHNRRFLNSGGAKLVEAALRAGQPCACLMFDVDHFKKVNDTYGHLAGDEVLRQVGQIIAAHTRKADLAVRYGGEEFAVVLSGATADQAATAAERLRQALAEATIRSNGDTLRITVSLGVAAMRYEVEYGASLLDDMLARADKALYEAKAGGRNRVVTEAMADTTQAGPVVATCPGAC